MAYLYGYMAEFTDMTTGALRILLLTTGVGGGVLALYACVCACILGCSIYSYAYLYGGMSYM